MTDVMTEDGVVEEYRTSPLAVTIDEYGAACQRLGLGVAAATLPRPNWSATADRAALHYPEWRGRVLTAWRKFMPTTYKDVDWGEYCFDQPPLRALKAIEAARELRVFQRLEIWTPERRQLRRSPIRVWSDFLDDPVCVGMADLRYFPVVRWGAEELVSERRVRLTSLVLRDPRY